ncbi:MAG TPA: MFS transporter [Candidatus Dormibacteraeota bacterium]|jgi:MFS family permease|nr:MFS transporter [Candidatus Dormibacteraeota bacterium]
MFAGRLWRQTDFLKLWAGQTVSLVGTAVTMLALPTIAILVLHASPLHVGLLAAVQRIPFPLLALFAGVWVDRVRRRPIMIAANVGRALAVASIPVAAMGGDLTLTHLYAVAVLLGTFSVAFDVSYLAYLPSLVESRDLVEGNTKLQISYSISGLLGPSLAGVLIQGFGAARSMLADAVSYVVSVAALLLIRTPEQATASDAAHPRRGMRSELGEGVRLVFGHEILRSLLLTSTGACLGLYLALPIMLIFIYEDLHLAPATAGLVFALEGIGQLLGALLAARLVRLLRLGPTLAVMQALTALTVAGLPLTLLTPAVPTLAILSFLLGLAAVAYDVNQVSLRQLLTPARLQGRMNATFRAFFWGVQPVASVLGGLLASTWGHAQTLILGGMIALASSVTVFATPLGRLSSMALVAAEPVPRQDAPLDIF